MAITVTPNLTDITMCETVTGWSGGEGEFLIDGDVPLQGTYCMSDWVDLTTGAVATYAITSTDMSGTHMYVWLYCSGVVDTKTNGGYRLYAASSGGTATWYVGGKDTHPAGGWNIFTVSLDATPDILTGTFDNTAVTSIGVAFKTLTAAPIKGQTRFNNVFWDAIRYGTGLTVTSASTDNISMADIYAVDDDSTLKYGVVTKPSGIDAYVVNGKITLGNTGTGTIDFLSSGEVVFFPSNDLVSSTFHGFEALGNTTGTTDVSSGVAFVLDFDGSNLNTISLVGNSFTNSSAPTFGASQTVTNNTFDGCGLITPSTATFTSNTVKNSAQTASYALFLAQTHNVSKTTYSDNYWGFGVTPATSGAEYGEDGGIFSGNTADVYNTHATNAVTINKLNGSNASTSATAGGVVTLVTAPVTTLVTVKDINTKAVIVGARVYLVAGAGGPLTEGTVIFNEVTDSNGQVSDTRALATDQPVLGRVRMSTSSPYYKNVPIDESIDSANGLTLNVFMIPDE